MTPSSQLPAPNSRLIETEIGNPPADPTPVSRQGLPEDLLQEAAHRLGIMCLVIAGLGPTGSTQVRCPARNGTVVEQTTRAWVRRQAPRGRQKWLSRSLPEGPCPRRLRWVVGPPVCPSAYRVSQPAKDSQAGVPEIISRSGWEATISSPPQMVAG